VKRLSQREVDYLVGQIGDLGYGDGRKARRRGQQLLTRDQRMKQALAAAKTADEKRLTPAEREFLQRAVGKGARVLRNGWPVFLVERDGETFAVEVKRGADDISGAQARMFEALERAGIKVYVWNPRRPMSAKPWMRFRPGRLRRLAGTRPAQCQDPDKEAQ
jgi:hypothetical protein